MITLPMKKSQQGFTLIELMIVVAIIGILASIALPAYQTYTKKAKFSEVVLGTAGIKTAVEICAQDQGDLTNCIGGSNGIVDVTVSAGNISSVTTAANGVITATAIGAVGAPSNGLEGETYILTPTFADGKVTWDTTAAPGTCKAANIC